MPELKELPLLVFPKTGCGLTNKPVTEMMTGKVRHLSTIQTGQCLTLAVFLLVSIAV